LPRRPRTGKQLAKRHDLFYFKRSHIFRSWKFALSAAIPAAALVWLVVIWVNGNQKVYSSGPVSNPHAVFGKNCATCHTTTLGLFRKHVQDESCLTCHDAPAHSATQTATPTCGSCHVEHKGAVRLASVSDQNCTQCHSDLKNHARGALKITANVDGFNRNHPQFDALAQKDPGTIKFNHLVHLRADLKDMQGKTVQLQCEQCHQPTQAAVHEAKGDGAGQAREPSEMKDSSVLHNAIETTNETFPKPSAGGAYMAPITFVKDCANCHSLQFDSRFEDQVPHDKPELVHQFLVARYSDYIAKHPGEMRGGPPQIERRIVSPILKEAYPTPNAPARSAGEWVQARVADSEQLLWRKTCRQCHTLDFGAAANSAGAASASEALPQVAKSAVTVRWLRHGLFDHTAHRMVACDSCHSAAKNSQDTADVLIPGIATCQSCHKGQPQQADAAENRCFECHQYHNWGKTRPTKGKYSIHQLLGSMQYQPAPAPETAALAAQVARGGSGKRRGAPLSASQSEPQGATTTSFSK
jgi:hypothetical protein